MSNMNRREFVIATVGVAACFACTNGNSAVAAETALPSKIDAGAVTDFAKDGIYDTQLKNNRVLVYRENGKLYASTGFCTHRKSLLKVVEGQARCAAHGSRFDADGKVAKGPATKSLVRYAVSINTAKHLIVDTTKTFDESQWSDAAASVAVG